MLQIKRVVKANGFVEEVKGNFCFSCMNRMKADPEFREYVRNKQASKCFIATAAYGSPFEPKLDVIRNFRDKDLIPNRFGKKIVDLYYLTSPPFATLLKRSQFGRIVIRAVLNKFINRLEQKEQYKIK